MPKDVTMSDSEVCKLSSPAVAETAYMKGWVEHKGEGNGGEVKMEYFTLQPHAGTS